MSWAYADDVAHALETGRPFSYDDLQEMPDDGHRHELVDGVLNVTPSPSWRHQDVVANLLMLLKASLGPDLVAVAARADYKVSDATVLEPDLIVARRADVELKYLQRTPILVVEVLSPSTRFIDFGTKRLAFEAAGVPAYWLVDPDAPGITELRLEEGRYVERTTVSGDEEFVTDFPVPVRFAPSSLVTI